MKYRERLLDLATDAGNSAERSPFELGHFERRGEHGPDERRVLVDLEGFTLELKLLNDLGGLVVFENHASGGNSEIGLMVSAA